MATMDYFVMRAKNDLYEDSAFSYSLALSCSIILSKESQDQTGFEPE